MDQVERVVVRCGDAAATCAKADAMEVADHLLAQAGVEYSALKFERVAIPDAPPTLRNDVPVVSTFESQVSDSSAAARIEAQHAVLKASGHDVGRQHQFFDTGTRMAQVGYDNQARRAQEHAAKVSIADACEALARRVRDEQREDVVVSAREFADKFEVNGSAKVFGLKLTEQALRGLCGRLESPAVRYVMGLRDRIATHLAERAAISSAINEEMSQEAIQASRRRFLWLQGSVAADKQHLVETIRREARSNPDVELKLRTRKGTGDVFAILSPSYTPADAPEVLAQVADHLPDGARGTWSYDSESTAWELRAHIWTPTPVAEQAVGEPFEGSASFFGRDNGTGRFGGGGNVTLIRCLNASTYVAEGVSASRIHRANVMVDLDELVKAACSSVDALCVAWGANQKRSLDVPEGLTIEQAIPGFWRHIFRDTRSELQGVLPGRAEKHVDGLTAAYFAERRDPASAVRSDLAQAWTRYVQDQPTPVRRQAEQAIGDWMMSARKIVCAVEE